MVSIFKYRLRVLDTQEIEMEQDARILSVQNQDDCITIWALVDDKKPMEKVSFSIFGTGHPVTGISIKYVATVQMDNGLVWHVFKNDI